MELPERPSQPNIADESYSLDPIFQAQIQRLHRLTVFGRWLFVGLIWLSVGSASLWGLRDEISLWREHFTWVAVQYGLRYTPLSTLGLCLCISMTLSVLIWQSRNILLGMPRPEKQRLEALLMRIRKQGESHPLWRWICQ